MSDFPFVIIPPQHADALGEPDPGTRTFRAFGPREGFEQWSAIVADVCEGRVVSPGGVSMIAPVSRAAVYKAMKDGRLTAFCYYTVTGVSWWSKRPKLDAGGRPYAYVPVSECKAWAEQLSNKSPSERRAERKDSSDGERDFLCFNPRKGAGR